LLVVSRDMDLRGDMVRPHGESMVAET
jgi:hypothetical protein